MPSGKFRVYFNNRNAKPSEAWIVDRGVAERDEFLLAGVEIHGVTAKARLRLRSRSPEPKAWLQLADAKLSFRAGKSGMVAVFVPAKSKSEADNSHGVNRADGRNESKARKAKRRDGNERGLRARSEYA